MSKNAESRYRRKLRSSDFHSTMADRGDQRKTKEERKWIAERWKWRIGGGRRARNENFSGIHFPWLWRRTLRLDFKTDSCRMSLAYRAGGVWFILFLFRERYFPAILRGQWYIERYSIVRWRLLLVLFFSFFLSLAGSFFPAPGLLSRPLPHRDKRAFRYPSRSPPRVRERRDWI